MKISLVVALSRNRVIGRNGGLPWRLPADLKHFKDITMGKPMLMGRKTYESIRRPLPGRRNLVLTSVPGYQAPGCEVVPDVAAALATVEGTPELMVIGGGVLFEHFLPSTDRIYLTEVDAEVEGDVYFPTDPRAGFVEVSRREREPDADNPYRLIFSTLDRM